MTFQGHPRGEKAMEKLREQQRRLFNSLKEKGIFKEYTTYEAFEKASEERLQAKKRP